MKNVFFGAAVICLVVGLSLSSFRLTLSAQRRIYWLCACLAGVFAFLAPYPKAGTGLAAGGALLGAMIVTAYVTSSYIKIGGKIYALTVADSQPDPEDGPTDAPASSKADPAPDSYGGLLTAAKMWWMLVVLAAISGINSYAALFSNGEVWVGVVGAVFIALVAVGAGYGDGSWGYHPARRQYLQLAIASAFTAGGFALLYFAAFYIARRRPFRRTQSLEYRAHPRHRKRDDD